MLAGFVEVKGGCYKDAAETERFELHPMYAWLREHEPLSRVRLPYGDQRSTVESGRDGGA